MKRFTQLSLSLLLSIAFVTQSFGVYFGFLDKDYNLSDEACVKALTLKREFNALPECATKAKKALADEIFKLVEPKTISGKAKQLGSEAVEKVQSGAHYAFDVAKENKYAAGAGALTGLLIGSGLAKKAVYGVGRLAKNTLNFVKNHPFAVSAAVLTACQIATKGGYADQAIAYATPIVTTALNNVTKESVATFAGSTAISAGLTGMGNWFISKLKNRK